MFLNVLYLNYGTILPNKRVFGFYRVYETPIFDTSFTQILTSISGIFGSYRVYNTPTCETTSFTKIQTSVRRVYGSYRMYNTPTCETTSFTKIRMSVRGGGVFGSYRMYNTPTCETTSFTQFRTSGRGLRILPGVQQTDVWNNASNTPHNVKTMSDQRPLCAIVGITACVY